MANSYLEITFPYSATVTGIILAGRLTTTQYFLSWQIQGSNNNVTWNNIYLASSQVSQTVTKYTFANSVAYKYIQFDGFGEFGPNPGLSYLQYLGY